MKKIIILTLIILLTGCSNYTELNDLAIIKSIGIDYQDNTYTLYAGIIEEVTEDNIPKIKVITVNNKSIKNLFNDIKLLVNKEIYLSHIDLIILSTSLNDENYQEIIDYFLKNKEFRNDFLAIFSNEIKELLEKSDYDEIEEIITTNKDSKNVINISFEEVIKSFLESSSFDLSYITYQEEIKYVKNLKYQNNKTEGMNNEKQKN